MNSLCKVTSDPLVIAFLDELDLKLKGSSTCTILFPDESFIQVNELKEKGKIT